MIYCSIYCSVCRQDKNISEFCQSQLKRTNHVHKCKQCISIYTKNYYERNRIKNIERAKKYQKENKEVVLKRKAKYRKNNKQKILEYDKQYHIDNKDTLNKKRNIRQTKRRKNEPLFRLRQDISIAVNYALKKCSSCKNNQSISKYIPFTIVELKEHLEKLFSSSDNLDQNGKIWMTWDNQGKYVPNDYEYLNGDLISYEKAKWQIDHIIPQSEFQYSSMENEVFKKCWALENLRPLRADINIKDGVNRTRHKLQNKY